MHDSPPARWRRSRHHGVCSVPPPDTPRSLCTRFCRTRRIGRRRRRTLDTPGRPGTLRWNRPRSAPARPCRGPGRGTAPSVCNRAVPGRLAAPLASSAVVVAAAPRGSSPASLQVQARPRSRRRWALAPAHRRGRRARPAEPHWQDSVARQQQTHTAQSLQRLQAHRTGAPCSVSSSLRPPLLTSDPASEAATGQRRPCCGAWNDSDRRRVAPTVAEPDSRPPG
jgi:hypothetical protein